MKEKEQKNNGCVLTCTAQSEVCDTPRVHSILQPTMGGNIASRQGQDMFWDDEELTSLLAKEPQNPLCMYLEGNPELESARKEAVEWMLKVNAHYSFSALTVVLAANYLDRFLFSFWFQNRKPWMTQLTAMACLYLIAKVSKTGCRSSPSQSHPSTHFPTDRSPPIKAALTVHTRCITHLTLCGAYENHQNNDIFL